MAMPSRDTSLTRLTMAYPCSGPAARVRRINMYRVPGSSSGVSRSPMFPFPDYAYAGQGSGVQKKFRKFSDTVAPMNRRDFLRAAAAPVIAAPYQRLASAYAKKIKITDVKVMIVRGTWDWNLIKVETDAGIAGIGEAYGGWGVKDLVLNKLKVIIVGEDPLN